MTMVDVTEVERQLVSRNRCFRYVLLVTASYFTLLDAIKQDAFNSALLAYLFPDEPNRTSKQIASALVTHDILLTIVQMLVIGLLEQFVRPSIWCTFNLLTTICCWTYFSAPTLSLGNLLLIFIVRCFNVRYSMLVHWFGPLYFKYTMAVQFFVSVLPYLLKLPLFHYYRAVVFERQIELLAGAVVVFCLLVSMLLRELPTAVMVAANGQSLSSSTTRNRPDKTGSWISNLSCSCFLAAVYFDFRAFDAYANRRLGYDITYDMVYVHVGLFVTVFLMNLVYNLFKTMYRRHMRLQELDRTTQTQRMNRARFAFVLFSFFGVTFSRCLFLALQLDTARQPSFSLLAVCVCLGGLGGNVQPLLAEFMFRQRTVPPPLVSLYDTTEEASRTRRARWWSRHSDQIFKWVYVDGRNLINVPLITLWFIVGPLVGPWWFTVNTIVLLVVSCLLFLVYYIRHVGVQFA